MYGQLRQMVRRHRRMQKLLLPWWIRLHHLRWCLRKTLTWHRPVSFPVGSSVARLHCYGQIPELLYVGDFESVERDFVVAYLRPGMCVLDVGANVGLYTVLASVLVGPTGTVHSFEPAPDTYRLLLRNIELNGCRNVFPNQVAAADTRKPMVLRVDPRHPSYDGHRFVEEANAVGVLARTDQVVESITLDEYAGRTGRVDFVKVDVEGAELLVLQGASEILAAQTDLTLMLECNRNRGKVAALLSSWEYRFFRWDVCAKRLEPSTFDEAAGVGNIIARRKAWCLQDDER